MDRGGREVSADVWHAAMKRARQLDLDRIAAAIAQSAPSGLKAARYDSDGGRTSRVECRDEGCPDGKPGTHSHHVVNDPTGNQATRGPGRDDTTRDRVALELARVQFIGYAGAVIRRVSSERPENTWQSIRAANSAMPKGTVQAALDLRQIPGLPAAIAKVDAATLTVETIAKRYQSRDPSEDEKHWDNREYNDNSVCAWHLAIHRRYRRPRVDGLNICDTCRYLSDLLEQKPPQWLLEAEVDREAKPKAWTAALSRCMDELGIVRESA